MKVVIVKWFLKMSFPVGTHGREGLKMVKSERERLLGVKSSTFCLFSCSFFFSKYCCSKMNLLYLILSVLRILHIDLSRSQDAYQNVIYHYFCKSLIVSFS